MNIEKLNESSYKVTVTSDYLDKVGIHVDELVSGYSSNISKLLNSIMTRIHSDFDCDLQGALGVQVHVITDELVEIYVGLQDEMDFEGWERNVDITDENDSDIYDDVYDEDSEVSTIYRFKDFEDVIQVSKHVQYMEIDVSSLYHYKGEYYLFIKFEIDEMDEEDFENEDGDFDSYEYDIELSMRMEEVMEYLNDVESVLEEYGVRSNTTIHMLQEYGKEILLGDAFEQLQEKFS